MAIWAIVLIVIGVVLVVGAVVYVVYRWGKKSTAARIALTGAAAILNVLESVFKDKPDKVDAYDFASAIGNLTAVCLETLNAAEAGTPFVELKVLMVGRVRKIVDAFPTMEEKVSDEIIEKAVDAFFMLVSSIPKVKDIVKK